MINKLKELFNKKNKNEFEENLEDENFDLEDEEELDFENENDFDDNLEKDDLEDDLEDDFDDDFDDDTKTNSKSKSPLDKIKENPKILYAFGGLTTLGILGYVLSPYFLNSVEDEEDMNDYTYVEPKKLEKKKPIRKPVKKPTHNKKIIEPKAKAKKTNLNNKKELDKKENINKNEDLVKKYEEFKKYNHKKPKAKAKYDFDKNDPKEEIIKENRKLLNKIEKSNIVPNKDDIIDPFAQEFESTLKMKQMQNALKESKKLMKEYTDFKLLQLAFEKTKNEYENNKMKNKYQMELNLVKAEFAKKLQEMNKALSEIQIQNNNLNNQIKHNAQKINTVSTKKTVVNENGVQTIQIPEEKEESLFNENITSKQVYKIGSTYLLEETDEFGRVKIYRKGNVYNNMKIIDISPDFLKVKTASGNTKILTINQNSSSAVGVYYNTKIKTSMESSVENEKVDEKNAEEIKTYGNALQDRKEQKTVNSLKSFNSRF